MERLDYSTDDQVFSYDKPKSVNHIVLQLQEARIGDKDRLQVIKESLNSGKELTESDKQYLHEKSSELKNAIDYLSKVEWTVDFIEKLQKERHGQSFTLETIKKLLEKEKSRLKIDKKFLEKASYQIKGAVHHQRELQWTASLIAQLKEAKIGDIKKLEQIKNSLQKGEIITENDQQYLKDKASYLTQILDCKKKVSWSINMIKKMQEAEIEYSRRLDAIRIKVEEGSYVSKEEINYANTRYEKLQKIMENQNKIEWTVNAIKNLQEHGIGDSDKLNTIKRLFEEERPIEQNDVNYLKTQYDLLQQNLKYKNMIQFSLDTIKKLHEHEIGNSERLSSIRKTIEEKRPVSETEINYLKEKYEQLLTIKKSREVFHNNEDGQTQEGDSNHISNDINTAILELKKSETRM
jgi:hypothetical protein